MKKLTLIFALLIYGISFSQDYKIVYQQVFSETWKDQKTMFEFKDNLEVLEVSNLESYFKLTLIRLTDYNEFTTEGGYDLYQSIYIDASSKLKIGIQLFKDEKYGIRMIFPDGTSFQYSDTLWKKEF